ncbi:MAG: tRNA (adenosine(37)-N6)-threonylcarbamoyltransferase complex dimerization subunit type 1 TsaB [Chloroflexota bacterium]|nr:tRNA (adenosine(37)-N6)-threonylcarbamoyltransferase complex dimerization subunit type 1 TsaB [Chloroflexota bacterium]
MLLLALDTSNRQASIALCSEDALLGEYSWHIGQNHSVELLEHISRLVAECGKIVPDIEVVAVAIGPGSFNGVRVALATAKALAFALNIPVVGVGTLDVLAAQQQYWSGLVCALMDAGRSEFYTACYSFGISAQQSGVLSSSLQRQSEYQVLSVQEISAFIQEQQRKLSSSARTNEDGSPVLFCGEIPASLRQFLHTSLPNQSVFSSPIWASRHASVLAMVALQRLQESREDNSALLEPLYIRRPSITTSTRKQPLLGGTSPATDQNKREEREEGALRH